MFVYSEKVCMWVWTDKLDKIMLDTYFEVAVTNILVPAMDHMLVKYVKGFEATDNLTWQLSVPQLSNF